MSSWAQALSSSSSSRSSWPGGCWHSGWVLRDHQGKQAPPLDFEEETESHRSQLTWSERHRPSESRLEPLFFDLHILITVPLHLERGKKEYKRMVSPQFSQHAISIIIILTICFAWNRQKNLILRNETVMLYNREELQKWDPISGCRREYQFYQRFHEHWWRTRPLSDYSFWKISGSYFSK